MRLTFAQLLTTVLAAVTLYSRALAAQDDAVTFTSNTFNILGQEVFLYSAEFHPWRLPVPALWRDPLQKLKAAGINTLSIYTHWGLIMPSPDSTSVSLDAPANRLADFLTIAKEVGLFVILRPGPYINAETNGGGMPGWVQNLDTQLRVNTTNFSDAWKPYVKAVIDAAAPFQVKAGQTAGTLDTSAGTLIGVQVENEFQQTADMEAYFDEIIAYYHSNGITVPTTFNALSGNKDYANNTQLSIWGQDSYPQNFDCYRPEIWAPVQSYTDLKGIRQTNPASIPEFQGGSYDAWGGSTYDSCAILTNASFVRVFEKSLIGDGVKFKSNYMGYGGTNWGNLAYGGLVYTSYDYGSGVNEMRIKRDKLDEMGLIGSFLQSFPDFADSAVAKQGENLGVSEESTAVFVSQMQTNESSWYVVRQSDSTSSAIATFKLNIGGQTIPQNGTMTLYGRDAIIVPVNATLNASSTILQYSTADVGFLGTIDERDVIFMHGQAGVQYEFAIAGVSANATQEDGVTVNQGQNTTVVQWTAESGQAKFLTFTNAKGVQVLIGLGDITYAHALQFVSQAPNDSVEYILGRGDRVIVHGAYHVANGTISDDVLALNGQLNATQTSTLEIFAPKTVKKITFNGAAPATTNSTAYGSLIAAFDAAAKDVLDYTPPALTEWRYNDSLPEINPTYQPDTNWRAASLTNTSNAWFANATTPNVLFADAYGFHSGGAIIWQARFNLTSEEAQSFQATSLNVHYIAGKFSASSTFLNGKLVGATDVPTQVQDVSATFALNKTAFVEGTNVFTVLMESTGLEEVGSIEAVDGYSAPRENTKQPRGIFTFDLVNSSGGNVNQTLQWLVTGKQGGETLLDTIRGPLNEGGFYGERKGWHLPGFDDSDWTSGAPTDGFEGANVRFYRTSVELDVPSDYDIPLSVVYGGNASDVSETWRSLLFVNGWQYGKRYVQFGPQTTFPIPPGIINPNGNNTIAVALWSPDTKGARLPSLTLEKQGVFFGAVDYVVNNPVYSQVRM